VLSGIEVSGLSHEGRGIAHIRGKVTFIDGALPAERVSVRIRRRGGSFDEAELLEVERAAPERIEARCRHFGVCGGCALQHLSQDAQISHKQAVLLEQLRHSGNLRPDHVMNPLVGPPWAYRRKARLGVKYVERKRGVLVGFRERHKRYVAELDRCETLHAALGERILAFRNLLGKLSIRKRIPQLEIAVGDRHAAVVLRILSPLSEVDKAALSHFGAENGFVFYLQTGGPDSVEPLNAAQADVRLSYALPHDGTVIDFEPLDFTQINFEVNRLMVERVVEFLAPAAEDSVLDLFCGLGNFSIPLARRGGRVLGVEGDARLIERARKNAFRNAVANVEFLLDDLTGAGGKWTKTMFHKVLLDPPRTGAKEALEFLDLSAVERLIYVSCNPATLARDAEFLVKHCAMRLTHAGIMDMFPQTSHIEAMAVFDRERKRP